MQRVRMTGDDWPRPSAHRAPCSSPTPQTEVLGNQKHDLLPDSVLLDFISVGIFGFGAKTLQTLITPCPVQSENWQRKAGE